MHTDSNYYITVSDLLHCAAVFPSTVMFHKNMARTCFTSSAPAELIIDFNCSNIAFDFKEALLVPCVARGAETAGAALVCRSTYPPVNTMSPDSNAYSNPLASDFQFISLALPFSLSPLSLPPSLSHC